MPTATPDENQPDLVDWREPQPESPPLPQDQTERLNIHWRNQTLRDVNAKCLEALKTHNSPPILFQSGLNIVRLRHDEFDVYVEPLNEHSMKYHLDQAANFVTAHVNKEGEWRDVPGPPHKDTANNFLAMPGWPPEVIPHLKGIIRCPVFAADGRLVLAPGYDAKSGLWHHPDPNLVIAPLPERPTQDDFTWARQLLMDDLLFNIPFAEPADKTNALAYLLTLFVREMVMSPVPLALIEAPAAGTGKGLLAKCLVFPALGRVPAATPPQTNDDQWRKLLTALLAGLPTVVLFDNISGTLKSQALEALLTSDIWQERLLVTNDILVRRVKAVFMATANNLEIGGDLPRRIVWLCLDAKMEHPEEQDVTQFKHPDLRAWMLEHRSELVRAALMLIQAWIAADKPFGPALMGSFESWTAVIGGILKVAGIDGFLANRKQKRRRADDDALRWFDFCEAWWKQHGTLVVGVKELFDLVETQDHLPWIMSGPNPKGWPQKLGRALKKVRNRCFGPYRVVEDEADNNNRGQYHLEVIDQEAKLPAPGSNERSTDASTTLDPKRAGDDDSDLENPRDTFCRYWWHVFGTDEVVDVVFTKTMVILGMIDANLSLDQQEAKCATIFEEMTGYEYDAFRIERVEEFQTTASRRCVCYRLCVVDGKTPPLTEAEEKLGRQETSKPHVFTAEDFDQIVAVLPSCNIPRGKKT